MKRTMASESSINVVDTASVMISQGDPIAAARHLVTAGVDELLMHDTTSTRVVFGRLGGAVDSVPELLLVQAQVVEQDLDRADRAEMLDQLVALATAREDAVLLRAAHAEQARDLTRSWLPDEAIELAERVLSQSGTSESATRARAMTALGGAAAIRRSPGDVARAERALREAAELARQLGLRTTEAQALSWLGYNTLYPEGDDQGAIDALDRALAVAVPGSGIASVTRVVLGSVLIGAGRLDEAATHLRAMDADARARGDSRSLAWAAWTWARWSAYRHDPVSFLTHLRLVDRFRSEWFSAPEGVEFLAEASELAQALGDEHTARRYLELAEDRARADGLLHMVATARAGFEARFGDPYLADKLLDVDPGYPAALPRHQWLRDVLRAVAAYRRGEVVEARAKAAGALQQADIIGHAHLLLAREPVLATLIISLAQAGGSDAAQRLTALRPSEVRVTLFGRFHVELNGVDCTPTGQPRVLVQRLALAGGSASVDQVIEWFWPDEGLDVGRRRARNLLNRLRAMSGDVVVRVGDHLRIPDATIDLAVAEAALDQIESWASDGPQSIRDAWRLVTGALLEEVLYEDWAIEARERIATRLAGAADRMAADAELHNDHPAAAIWIERAIELDPYDLERYDRLVDILDRIGDRNRRQAAVQRALATAQELGVEYSPTCD